jgi:hypothetical protein
MARIAAFALASLLPFAAWAQQIITLRNGSQFSGRMIGVAGDSISFRDSDGGTRRYDANQIDSIRFENRERQDQGGNSYRPPDSGSANRDSRGYPAGSQNQNAGYMTLPAGTEISVRTNENINSQNGNQGRSYSAEVSQDVVDQGGSVVVPRGSGAQLVVRRLNDNNLALDLQSISLNGQSFTVNTADVTASGTARQGLGENKRTAEYVGGTAVLGTLLGAIAGGGKGAAIGALAGGAAGAGAQVLTRGNQVNVPAESVLNFRLDNAVSLNSVR